MSHKFAILIDGGFVRHKLGTRHTPLTAEKLVQFTEKLRENDEIKDMSLHRIYYYDSEPLSTSLEYPLSKDSQDRTVNLSDTSMYRSNKSLIDGLRQTPHFAVRLGILNWSKNWMIKNLKQKLREANGANQLDLTLTNADLKPEIQQKGVDLRIGMDIASLSLKNHVDVIVLVTGDSDFILALKFARREGKQTVLVDLGNPIKPSLSEHADIHINLDANHFRN